MKYAILGCGEFWDINHFNNNKGLKHTSKNFRKVKAVCDSLIANSPGIKFEIVKINKMKEKDWI